MAKKSHEEKADKETPTTSENAQAAEAPADKQVAELINQAITDAAIGNDKLYFIKDKKVIEKNKYGKETELFDFNTLDPAPESVTVEGFYLNKLVFLMDGKLVYLTERSTLGLLAE